ncbi:MAG: MerR family transcriptional regulator [gamma proteobacterium symbiont of Bathyaustriella thionipta]|nr:MerR family transcriptional regulator [gamma proteobacterium symbiont of Bathyaustriella thionipta]MCU7949270.1 MerR family transcriptional regulator [gamma proteobacterium symbiont of Bathyaustriella thionipta]MCU7954410.1 MerR family transcriptional regulator [gamma proteobacterium symbiont of Bathyaustriella thionipta]MCU7955869.1 MerR family transcriptional regulator [gamma proteobacterium symbiont of Bathyaustriella thionipta]MCU7967543.1 MerR family transcriptional regulator [gamma pro
MEINNYKIGEVASKLATSIRTIRYYEEEGLLIPTRTPRGTRLYSENHLARLHVILRLAKLGFSIEAIRKIAEIRVDSQTGDESSNHVEHHLEEVLNTIGGQIKALEKVSHEINDARRVIAGCHGCSNTPSTQGCPDCPVRKNLNDIELLNLVWDTE